MFKNVDELLLCRLYVRIWALVVGIIYLYNNLHLGRENSGYHSFYCNDTYNVDKMQNNILKIHLFHTPVSNFSLNRKGTMGDIAEKKLAMKNSFHMFGGRFFAHSLFYILTNTISRKMTVNSTSEVHFISPNVRVRVVAKE